MKKIVIPTPEDFSFKSTVFSHGWSDLLPFELNLRPLQIGYTLQLTDGTICHMRVSQSVSGQLDVELKDTPSDQQITEIITKIKRMFRLTENFDEFYRMAGNSEQFKWIAALGAGRMLRSASLWEDMVKMLCTTNCTWRLTQIMVENLVKKLGQAPENDKTSNWSNAFPDAAVVAGCSEDILRNEIKMGYRAPYLLIFARQIVNGQLKLEAFEEEGLTTSDLYKMLRSVKGFGDYAVSNLLKLLGHYDQLGADSWSRKKFYEKYNKSLACPDTEIQKHYEKFGKWAGLFFWMNVSEHWYQHEVPWS
jgi:N-glycosylase/DNA lyase